MRPPATRYNPLAVLEYPCKRLIPTALPTAAGALIAPHRASLEDWRVALAIYDKAPCADIEAREGRTAAAAITRFAEAVGAPVDVPLLPWLKTRPPGKRGGARRPRVQRS